MKHDTINITVIVEEKGKQLLDVEALYIFFAANWTDNPDQNSNMNNRTVYDDKSADHTLGLS